MTAVVHGVDLVDLRVVRLGLTQSGKAYLDRLFSPAEQSLARDLADPVPFYGGRLAVKEAVLKALGIGWRDGVAGPEIQVLRRVSGRPFLRLQGYTFRLARQHRVRHWSVSISHSDTFAVGSAIALCSRTGVKARRHSRTTP